MKKSTIASAVAAAIGLTAATVAQAVAVTGLTIVDVGSSTANGIGFYSAVTDGRSGGFKFASTMVNAATYGASTLFTGDAGTGTMLGGGVANPTGSFSTGFIFSSAPFVPFTFGTDFNADVTAGALSISTLNFGGNFGGGTSFNLPPDAGTLQILWTTATANADDFDVAFRWTHNITSAEDPSLKFTAFTAQWILEGCASTVGNTGAACGAAPPIPVPAAVWLFGSGLLGLVGVARRRKSTKA
jgi:hypothetical protein